MSIVYNVAPKDLGKFEEDFAKYLREEQERGVREAAPEMTAVLVEASSTIHDQNSFSEGWRAEIEPLAVTMKNIAPHAVFVEEGRQPNKKAPPVKAIVAWVVRHLGDPNLAFVVARKIGRDGIKARPVLEPNRARLQAIFSKHMNSAWGRAAQRCRR